jgi:hypothetical protein
VFPLRYLIVAVIAVSQVIERIIGVVRTADPALTEVVGEVDLHERALNRAPYQSDNE